MLELECLITSLYIDGTSIEKMKNKGWTFVCTIPASTVHPHALPNDKATIFSKYTEPTNKEDLGSFADSLKDAMLSHYLR